MTVIQLPPRPPKRPPPDAVSVAFDFGAWSVVFFREGRFAFRRYMPSKREAQAEAERLVREGGYRWFRSRPGGGDAA